MKTTQIGPGGAITLLRDVPNVLGYRVYRVAAPTGVALGYFTTATAATYFNNANGSPTAGTPPTHTNATGVQTTIPIAIGAGAGVVQAALAALPSIGKDAAGDDNVHVTSSGAGHYTIEFVNDLAGRSILTLVGNVSSLRSNGLHAVATIDGGADPAVPGQHGRRDHRLARERDRHGWRRGRLPDRHRHGLRRRLPARAATWPTASPSSH